MKWMRERDALIAQTLAFVQSVTGRRDAGESSPAVVPAPAPPPPAPIPSTADIPSLVSAIPEALKSLETKSLEKSAEPVAPSPSPRPLVPSDFQRELKARIASFRAHQERFNREREEYFSATLERLRAAIKDGPPPTPRA